MEKATLETVASERQRTGNTRPPAPDPFQSGCPGSMQRKAYTCTQPAFPKRMNAHIKEWIDSRSAPRWTARWDHPLRVLGCGRRFLTQTQLPNRAGRTASLLLRLKFKSSKIIIIPLAPPTDLLLHGATAQGLGGLQRRGGGWGLAEERGASRVLLGRLKEEGAGGGCSPGAGQGSHGGKVTRDPLASSADPAGGAQAAWCACALRAGSRGVWP